MSVNGLRSRFSTSMSMRLNRQLLQLMLAGLDL